ncbi:hypothetical protein JOM56_014354 [Amanita muscaria]
MSSTAMPLQTLLRQRSDISGIFLSDPTNINATSLRPHLQFVPSAITSPFPIRAEQPLVLAAEPELGIDGGHPGWFDFVFTESSNSEPTAPSSSSTTTTTTDPSTAGSAGSSGNMSLGRTTVRLGISSTPESFGTTELDPSQALAPRHLAGEAGKTPNFVRGVPSCSSLATTGNTFSCSSTANSSDIIQGLLVSIAESPEMFPWQPVLDGPTGVVLDYASRRFP